MIWALLAAAFLVALAVAGWLTLCACYLVVRVDGESMSPALRPGERVLVQRFARRRVRAGSIVLLRMPGGTGGQRILKRASALPGDPVPDSVQAAVHGKTIVPAGALVVLADNPLGIDSRRWGFIARTEVVGLVVRKLPAPLRRDGTAVSPS